MTRKRAMTAFAPIVCGALLLAEVFWGALYAADEAIKPVAEWSFDDQPDGVARLEGGADLEFPGVVLPPAAFTFDVRVKAAGRGGLLQTRLASLVVHESGILVAILPLDGMYREIPLSPISFEHWHDLRLRWEAGTLELIIDGVRVDRLAVKGRLAPLDDGPTRIGGWKMPKPAVPGFAPSAVAWLFERPFHGMIDRATIWNRAVTSAEQAAPGPESAARRCLADYRAFYDASRAKDVAEVQRLGLAMRRFMARDPRRPVYHLTAPMGEILDPAGAYFDGQRYHVFSYRNLISLLSATPLAHYVSDDLVHWQDLPIAVWPDSELDVQGIWLGNIFRDDAGDLRMLYTALGRQGKIGVLARSRDGLLSFEEKRAVMTGFMHHDGHVWKDGAEWLALTTLQHWGRRPGDLGDAVVLLRSPDLDRWTMRGELFAARKRPASRDENQRLGFAEFPYLIPFGDRHALMLGTRPVRYWIGRFDKSVPSFIPDEPEGRLLDVLNSFHCFNPSVVDARGRRIIMAMNCHLSGAVDGVPWAGAHTLPRLLTREGNHLRQEPIEEVENLRGGHQRRTDIAIPAGASGLLPGLSGDTLEIIAEFEPGTARRFGLMVRGGTRIYLDTASGRFGATGNVKLGAADPELGEGPAFLQSGQTVRLRVFLDRALLEVFVNGQTGTGVLTSDPTAQGLDLFSEGGDATLRSLDVWQMRSIWP
jgi:sucrose-6-phosphate hydrolase SacC (GH32 family)